MMSEKGGGSDINSRDKVATTKRYWLRLTNFCNNHCVFCLDSEQLNGNYVSFAVIKQSLVSAFKKKYRRVILSGGEPTIHPEFLQIVKLAKETGYTHIQVITNGRFFFYEDFLKKAVKNGLTEATFSIHGDNSVLHDSQTGIKGSFLESLTGLKNALRIPDFIVSVDIVINKYNYRYLHRILNYFIGLGVYEFDLLQVTPNASAWKNRKKVIYSVKPALRFLKKAFNLSKIPHLHLWTNRFPAIYLEGFEDLIQHPDKLKEEIYGRREMFDKLYKQGVKMHCYGQRCNLCFLKDICNDFISLREDSMLKAKKHPFCIEKIRPALNPVLRPSDIVKGNTIRLDLFTDFFIKYRYFLKGVKCNNCPRNLSCDGAPIQFVRRYGFKSLGFYEKKISTKNI